ncbi:TraB/GumN family protein [Gracilibacillus xinjiangensis]|uniref:TraB/GumN family protein n=1 Tax=Gracilibacillus xinjiangensis TaxID=1193282 RepID=A0ABV8WUU3_9BACI
MSNFSLSESLGMSAEQISSLGVDMYFMTNAFLDQKPIKELEGMKAQADMFDGLSPEAQEEYLVQTLDSVLDPDAGEYNEAELINEWFGHWINGDVNGFTESFTSITTGEPTEFDEMLFGTRDKDMAEKIMGLLESEESATSFIVVGAGHFTMDESILYHLEQNDYQVIPFYE